MSTGATKVGALAVALLLLIVIVQAQAIPAATQLDLQRCLNLTTARTLATKKILSGLELTADQVRELRSRLLSYNSVSGYRGIDGIGLTREQKAEILRRIAVQVAEMNRYPLGWPCKPFVNPTRVARWVKAKLIANGYRPAMSFRKTSPRQFQFRAIQDGVEQFGVVAKSGRRQIAVRVQSVSPRWGRTYRFTLGFDA